MSHRSRLSFQCLRSFFFSLSGADFFRLTLLLSASQEQTSFGWRFFFQPFRSRLPAVGASFSLSGADFLRLAFLLSASQQQTPFD
jgi:hypothetical protein